MPREALPSTMLPFVMQIRKIPEREANLASNCGMREKMCAGGHIHPPYARGPGGVGVFDRSTPNLL